MYTHTHDIVASRLFKCDVRRACESERDYKLT